MKASDLPVGNYNYYPWTLVKLNDISNSKTEEIPAQVAGLGLEVVWGPAELKSPLGPSYSLMYACKNHETNEFTLVIRGTEVDSLIAWFSEDFAIHRTQPFSLLAPHAPADALISQGTYNGMRDLLSLKDPATGIGVVEFLQNAQPGFIYVTGHSLGGTLTPPMFAYLNDIFYGSKPINNMAMWSFAGLTPGDAGFNAYLKSLYNPDFSWRFFNTIDIAPNCWWSLSNIENIYVPFGLTWGFPEDDVIKELFKESESVGYVQPDGGIALEGKFNTGFIDDHIWGAQAVYQHVAPTYVEMVQAAFPYTP